MKLKFGTGGLRAVMGEGEDCINFNTIQIATLGVAAYAKKNTREPSVAISYDTRNNSEQFAKEAARILALEGCIAYIYPVPTPTPMLSFAVRELKCHLGICITASHNPKEYNGYKVYGKDGCQITNQTAGIIQEEINCADIDSIREWKSFEELIKERRIAFISERINEAYFAEIKKLRFEQKSLSGLRIVYTPLNGTGLFPMMETMGMLGIRDVTLVEEQTKPDGEFPTCPCPNPEEDEVLTLGISLCKKMNADILLATDPDSDRIGVVAKNGSKYEKLNGNQLGVLLLEYILKMRKYYETIPENPIVIKTIVTTSMVDRIAEEYGAKVIDTLTGFKYIGEQIGNLEKIGEVNRFVFALEESCGYLSGPYVRDKDAIGTAALICEMTEYYKRQGKTLWKQLDILYEQYGRYSSILETVEYEQFQEQNRMEKLRNKLKSENKMMYEGILITKYEDYQQGLRGLPKSNVIKMWLNNGSTIVVRPSGTEPKLKIYKEMYIGQ